MAVTGFLQAIVVDAFLGRFAVVGYALAGAVIWHVAVRPAEDADLQRRFGTAYVQYQQIIGRWIPWISLATQLRRRFFQHFADEGGSDATVRESFARL